MALLSHNSLPLFEKQQKGENTDCSFVFKVHPENKKDLSSEKKIIHAHKLVLSSVSQYFAVNFKSEWHGNSTFNITACDYFIFEKLIRTIYLGEISFETLEEACQLYKAADFFQIEGVLDLLREKIVSHWHSVKTLEISQLVNTALQHQDCELINFTTNVFVFNALKIIKDPDFLKYSSNAINFMFQRDDLLANEIDLVKALETVSGTHELKNLKPAIGAIRFLALSETEILSTSLLSDSERDFLLLKKYIKPSNSSKYKKPRKVKSFFELLSSETQHQLREKFSRDKCWFCKAYHDVHTCQKVKCEYAFYSTFSGGTKNRLMNMFIMADFKLYSKDDIIKILKTFQKYSAGDPYFSYFKNIDAELENIYYL